MTKFAIQARIPSGTSFSIDPVALEIGDRGSNEFDSREDAEQAIRELQLAGYELLDASVVDADSPADGPAFER